MKKLKFGDLEEPVLKLYDDDDGISKPSKEHYEESKKACSNLSQWISMSRKRQNELLDALFEERESEKQYIQTYKAHQDLIRRYEIYEEIQSGS